MIKLTPQQYEELQHVVDWETATPLPDGRLLGDPTKRGCLIPASDYRVNAIREKYGDGLETILELGPCEGYFTVQLAPLCKKLVSIEARPKNIVCTLTRLFFHEIHNVELRLGDVRELDDSFGRFDLLFHSGVLYHLTNPVEHLFQIRHLSDRLYLDTHYLIDDDDRFPRDDLHYRGKIYRAARWTEMDLNDIWSGLQSTSRMLYRDSLLELLHDAGFDLVNIISQGNPPFAPRIGLIAERGEKISNYEREESQDALVDLLRRELSSTRKELAELRDVKTELQQLRAAIKEHQSRSLASRAWGRARRALAKVRNLVIGA